MKILRAEHLGMCFGVRDAIKLARDQAASEPLTVLGELVHNQTVLRDLRTRGIRIVDRPGEVATRTVMITAHGASDRAKREARGLGFNVMEATCPLVQFAHRSLAELVRGGFHPVIVGSPDHVEVRGLTGDLQVWDVVLEDADVDRLTRHARFGVVAQTTQPIERVHRLVRLIRERFPASEVRFRDTVCQPTKQRQSAAVELAQRCSVVIVVGGSNSNNTRELVRTCSRYCARVHHVQTAAGLRAEWFQSDDTVGITAGTSTPDVVIDGVHNRLRVLSAVWEALSDPSARKSLVPVASAKTSTPVHA